MKKSLGTFLKNQRILKNLSLRQLETLTNISNAYLSQLENDKIKSPSISTLHKIAEFYQIDFNIILEVAGISNTTNKKEQKSHSSFALSSESLSEEEEEELLKYLKFLRTKND